MTTVGAWLSNLIVPQNPVKASVLGAVGTWELDQGPNFTRDSARVEAGEICGTTYSAEATAGAPADDLVQELRVLCISASFLTGRAVTVHKPTPHSKWVPIRPGDGFPRERAMTGLAAVASSSTFESAAAQMVSILPNQASTNKIDVLCHHLVSALSGWCLALIAIASLSLNLKSQRRAKRQIDLAPFPADRQPNAPNRTA
jgi:hypothetical protein